MNKEKVWSADWKFYPNLSDSTVSIVFNHYVINWKNMGYPGYPFLAQVLYNDGARIWVSKYNRVTWHYLKPERERQPTLFMFGLGCQTEVLPFTL